MALFPGFLSLHSITKSQDVRGRSLAPRLPLLFFHPIQLSVILSEELVSSFSLIWTDLVQPWQCEKHSYIWRTALSFQEQMLHPETFHQMPLQLKKTRNYNLGGPSFRKEEEEEVKDSSQNRHGGRWLVRGIARIIDNGHYSYYGVYWYSLMDQIQPEDDWYRWL